MKKFYEVTVTVGNHSKIFRVILFTARQVAVFLKKAHMFARSVSVRIFTNGNVKKLFYYCSEYQSPRILELFNTTNEVTELSASAQYFISQRIVRI